MRGVLTVGQSRTGGNLRETRHVHGLDGVRGLAVATVVAYHLGFGWARGGYLGVDTFLVLSGYLITSGLLSEHASTGRVRLRAFWARRARRLLPALVVLLAAVAIYVATVALPDEARSLRLDSASALGFVSNWRFISTSQGYFGQTAAPSLLRHTWSLGVEAQLYLVWPLVVMAVVGRWGQRRVLGVAGLLAAASAALGMVLASRGTDISRAYYGTDTRAAAFLLGAAVAAFFAGRAYPRQSQQSPPSQQSPRSERPAAPAGALGIGGLAVTLVLWATLSGTSPWLFRGGLALAAIASAAMIVDIVARPAGLASRTFSVGPLRLLGRVSYGVYLWHWPLVLVLDHRRTGLSGMALLAVRLAAIAAATTASWVLIERPILRYRHQPRPTRVRWQPALAAALCVGMAAMFLAPSGPKGAPSGLNQTLVASPPKGAPSGLNQRVALSPPNGAPSGLNQRLAATSSSPVTALMLGDSVAFTLARALQPFGASYQVNLVNGGLIGCGVAVGSLLRSNGQVAPNLRQCQVWQSDWERQMDAVRPAVTVILLGRWEMLDRVIDGQWHHVGQPAFDSYLSGLLDQALVTAQQGGATVVMCTAPYYQGVESPQGGIWPENDPARVDRFNELVRQAVSRHPGVVLFDLHALVSPRGRFASTIGGAAIRTSDGIHFGPEAGAYVTPTLLPLIAAEGRSKSPALPADRSADSQPAPTANQASR